MTFWFKFTDIEIVEIRLTNNDHFPSFCQRHSIFVGSWKNLQEKVSYEI